MKIKTLLNILCAVILLITLVFQFTPYWTYEYNVENTKTEASVSISDFVWFPTEHNDSETGLRPYLEREAGEEIDLNSFVVLLILVLVLLVVGVVLTIINPKEKYLGCISIACGILGLIKYLADPFLKLGSLYILHIILFALATVFGIIALVINSKKKKIEE